QVEVFFPDSTEAVLVRFNRLLADMRVADAIAPAPSDDPGRVLVVYDGRATGLKEVQLLGRLFKDFPGANTRMVLLLHSASADAEAKAEALGKRTIRWDALRPSAEEARVLLSEASEAGAAPAAQAVLDRVGVQGMEAAMALKAGLRALSKADEALAEPAASRAASADDRLALERAQQFAASMAKAKAEQSSAASTAPAERQAAAAQPAAQHAIQPKRGRKFSPILLVGLFALSASAAISLVQQLPAGFIQNAQEGLRSLVGMETERKSADATPAEATPADARPEDSSSADAATADPPLEVGAKTLGPMPERLTDLEIQQDPKLRAQQAELTVTQGTEPPPKSEPPKLEAPKAGAPSAAPAKPVALASMTKVAPGWYVQHLSRESRVAVEQFYKAQPKLAKARLLRLKRIGAEGDNWVLLSGPFKTLDEAKAYMATPGLPPDMWVRPASAIRKMLPDASSGAGA
ncbi:MAG: hypothetical protein ACO3QP_03695, partial [Burkholderiaceae bacterium]